MKKGQEKKNAVWYKGGEGIILETKRLRLKKVLVYGSGGTAVVVYGHHSGRDFAQGTPIDASLLALRDPPLGYQGGGENV